MEWRISTNHVQTLHGNLKGTDVPTHLDLVNWVQLGL